MCHSSAFPDYSSPDPIPVGLQQPSGSCRITWIIVACLAPNHNFSWKTLPHLYRNLSSNSRSGIPVVISASSRFLPTAGQLSSCELLLEHWLYMFQFTVSSDLILSTSDLASALVSMKHETTNYSFASRYFQSGLFCKHGLFHDFKIKLMTSLNVSS